MRMRRPQVVVQRKPGRPRSVSASDEPAAAVHLTLDADDYDFAYRRARRDGITVPEVIRRAIKDWRARQR